MHDSFYIFYTHEWLNVTDSLFVGAIERWVLAHPGKAAVTQCCEVMAGVSSGLQLHKELDDSRYASFCILSIR